jgi:hypothetical protein
MVFTAAMFIPKSDNGATGVAPGDLGQPSYDSARAVPSQSWHLDPAVSDRRGGVRPGAPSDAGRMRGHTSTAPGEVNEVMVPSMTKEAGNGGRSPEDALGTDGTRTRPSTSGTPTPLAPNRHAERPGQGRHPVNGQYQTHEALSAGQPTSASGGVQRLDQKPHGTGVFPSAGGGPFAAQAHDPMTRPPREVSPGSALEFRLAEHASTVGARRLDLRTPAGLPDGLRNVPDPTPVSRPQTGLNDTAGQRMQATPGDIPHPPGSPQWGGPDPLATAISAHGSATAFGVRQVDVTGTAPGWE